MILGLTALVWLAVAMSERREYSIPVKVEMTGFDVNRYAVLAIDSSLTLQVESTGFNALFLSLRKKPVTIQVEMNGKGERRSVAVSDLSELLSRQLSSYGIHHTGSQKDSLTVVLSARCCKTFRPNIEDVRINFADGYGLFGEPLLAPSEVTLYGPQEVLATIGELKVQPMEINDVHETGNYRVTLDTSWKRLGDIYASVNTLTLNVPVERYVERDYSVPVIIEGVDTSLHLRLYPDHVVVRAWVVEENAASVTPDRFSVTADFRDIQAGTAKLKLRLNQFPRDVRIRKLDPEEIEYIIIK